MGVLNRSKRVLLGARGSILLESVMAVLLFSVVGSAVLSGLSTVHRSSATTERQAVLENIARNQMNYLNSQPFVVAPFTYASSTCPGPAINLPAGYSITCIAETYSDAYLTGDDHLSKLVVTVDHEGQQQMVLETLRGN